MLKKKKLLYIAAPLLILLITGGYFLNWYLDYEKANTFAEEPLKSENFSEVQFLEPVVSEDGTENAYILSRYSSSSSSDIEKAVELVNGLKFTDELVSSETVGVGVPRRLKLIAKEGEDIMLYLSADMKAISLPGEEVLRYTRYPLFQKKNILELIEFEKVDEVNLLEDTEKEPLG